MPSFTRTRNIDRAPAQVFAVLDDIQMAHKWMPSIKKVEVLTPDRPVGVGYRWKETRRVMGILRMSFDLAIDRHERNKAWGLGFTDGKVKTHAQFDLEPEGRGTKVTLTETCEDVAGKPKRAERIFKMMERSDGDLVDRLKAYVESTTEPPADMPAAPAKPPAPAAASPKPAKTDKAPAKKAAPAKAKAAAKPPAKKR